ncbi:uncharacterized protein LOC123517317 isoform X2 [Portunus trituberculatus]|nr:uncharacterized protein LOC123517317 isoform X2 [Portunus trituberculatus]
MMVVVAWARVSYKDVQMIHYKAYNEITPEYGNAIKSLEALTKTKGIEKYLGNSISIAECHKWQCDKPLEPVIDFTECFQYLAYVPCRNESTEEHLVDWCAVGYKHRGSCECVEMNHTQTKNKVTWTIHREDVPPCNDTIPPYNATSSNKNNNSSFDEESDVIELRSSIYKKSIFIKVCRTRECKTNHILAIGSTTPRRANLGGITVQWNDETCQCSEQKVVARDLETFLVHLTLCNGENINVHLKNVTHNLDKELDNCNGIQKMNRPTHTAKMGEKVNGTTERSSITSQTHTHTNTTSQKRTTPTTHETSPTVADVMRMLYESSSSPPAASSSGLLHLLLITTTFTILMYFTVSASVT